jgi:Leucine-rich repeat (LRR) protein
VDSCFALDGPLTALTALTRLQLHSNRLRAAPKAALALPNLRQISLGNNYYDQGQAEAALVLGVLPGLKQLDWAGPAPGAAALPAVQRWVGSCR